jgi:hypothetical protein
MAYWGISYAAGPNYNLPWYLYDPAGKAAALAAAYDAMQGALARTERASPVEQALIRALPARYPQREAIEDQAPWDAAYADAMRSVFHAYRDDLEVREVFAEAIMNLTPWKMWDLKTGGVAEGAGTLEAMEVLESAFRDFPGAWDHPGLLHLYVHLMEMSPFPQRALRAGDRLRDLVPDAGHLIHMPTHVDVLCGHYRDVLVYNHKAIVADRKFLAREGALNVYALYRTHDYHFAIYGAMFLGQYGPAMAAAQELIDTTPEELLRIPSPPMADFVEGYLPMKQHVLIRFGKWREIIAQELPADRELYCSTTAMMLYAQTVAHSALGHIAEAEKTRAAFMEAKQSSPRPAGSASTRRSSWRRQNSAETSCPTCERSRATLAVGGASERRRASSRYPSTARSASAASRTCSPKKSMARAQAACMQRPRDREGVVEGLARHVAEGAAARRRRDRKQRADQALVGVAGGEAEEEAAAECGHVTPRPPGGSPIVCSSRLGPPFQRALRSSPSPPRIGPQHSDSASYTSARYSLPLQTKLSVYYKLCSRAWPKGNDIKNDISVFIVGGGTVPPMGHRGCDPRAWAPGQRGSVLVRG